MTCSHCHGLIVEDRFMDWTTRWRGLSCGHVLNSTSAQNHLTRQNEALLLKNAEQDYWEEEAHLDSESVVGPDATSRCLRSADELSRRKPAQKTENCMLQEVRPPAAQATSATARSSKRRASFNDGNNGPARPPGGGSAPLQPNHAHR